METSMHWYTIRVAPGGGPGLNGEGPYTVADEREAEHLAADYRREGHLTLTSYSVDVRGAKDMGPVVILAPHLISIKPREAPTTLGAT